MAKSHQRTVWLKAVVGTVLVLISLALIGAWSIIAVRAFYKDKIYPGVYVGSVNLSGQTKAEAKATLEKEVEKLKSGVAFSWQDKKVVVSLSSISFDGSLAYQLFSPDVDKTVDEALARGRQDFFIKNLTEQATCWLSHCGVDLAVDYNKPKILELLKDQFGSFESPARDAQLVWDGGDSWRIEGEKFGQRFDYEAVFISFEATLKQVQNNSVRLILEEDAPKIFSAEVGDLTPSITAILDKAPLIIKFAAPPSPNGFGVASKSWVAQRGDIRAWLDLKIDYQKNSKQVSVDIDNELLKKYLDRHIAPSVAQSPLQAKFTMQDGRVSLFQSARDGQEIDVEATAEAIRQALKSEPVTDTASGRKVREAVLGVKVASSDTTINGTNDLGIDEIIGTGTSTFSGSPVNRRHNIAVGAKAINGLLIKPGEEFSLVKALGEIDAKAGYRQELVIKQNKTIPEFGGGLCQIGTTLFRTVLDSGLPVTERRNHSYRVVYYEPAGTDATIYDPWPDFKFINDTGNYILIQTRIEGDKAIFEFWGKRDGRTVAPIKPKIYNITKPAPTKIVETLSLKPGVKKCTEGAHNGADAWFDYVVTYPNGEVKTKRFSSHYVPWQAVCLIGVEKLTDPNAPVDGVLPPGNPDAINVVAPTSTAN